MDSSIDASADVLIVGAGPAGSATAALLGRAGVRVIAVDRACFPRDKPCSEFLSPEAVRVLARLGVLDAVERDGGARVAGLRVSGPRGSEMVGEFARTSPAPFCPTGLSVARTILDAHLAGAARAAGARLIERAVVEELLYDRGHVAGAVVRLAGGERATIRARVTVGADGLRSIVARRVTRRTFGAPRRIAFVAHCAEAGPGDGFSRMAVGRESYAGVNPLGGGIANVAVVIPEHRALAARGRATAFFRDELERFATLRERVDPRELARRVLVTGPFAAWSSDVTGPGFALVGDAADFFDPFTGDGICAALRGAEFLAAELPAALAEPGLVGSGRLAGYRALRRRAFAGKWAIERLIGFGMWAPRLFDRAVSRLAHRPALADALVGATGEYVPAREILNPLFLARMIA